MAADDSSWRVSMNPALSPSSPWRDLFSLNKNSIYLVFLKFYFSKLSHFPLNLLFSLMISSSGFMFWVYSMILRLFL